MSDNEFLRELKRDRDEYFTRLVKTHTHQVLREVQYTLRDGQYEGDAEDVAQRVWLKVYLYLRKPLEEIQAIDNIQAWLMTIARHETANYIREKKVLKGDQCRINPS